VDDETTRATIEAVRRLDAAFTPVAGTAGLALHEPGGVLPALPGLDALVIDLDAHVLVCHSEKEQAAPTFKHSFGYHPVRREALTIRAEVRDRRLRPSRRPLTGRSVPSR